MTVEDILAYIAAVIAKIQPKPVKIGAYPANGGYKIEGEYY